MLVKSLDPYNLMDAIKPYDFGITRPNFLGGLVNSYLGEFMS